MISFNLTPATEPGAPLASSCRDTATDKDAGMRRHQVPESNGRPGAGRPAPALHSPGVRSLGVSGGVSVGAVGEEGRALADTRRGPDAGALRPRALADPMPFRGQTHLFGGTARATCNCKTIKINLHHPPQMDSAPVDVSTNSCFAASAARPAPGLARQLREFKSNPEPQALP